METPIISLTWFAAWAVILTFVVAVWRVRMVMSGKMAANAFPSGQKHGGDAYWRANRAQMNTLEYLPVFAALVFAGVHVGLEGMFGTLCLVAVIGRIVQSLAHLSSGSNMAVNVRFAGLLVQLICFSWIAVLVLCSIYAA